MINLRRMVASICWAMVGGMACGSSVLADGDRWPEFRGPTGQGHADAGALPLHWDEVHNVAWQTPIAGQGWSSPVIWDQQLWLTTATFSSADEDQQKKRLAATGGTDQIIPLLVSDHLELRAVCLDRATGKEMHQVLLFTVDQPDPIHTMNSYASPTPVLDDGHLYCHFGTNGTACLDTRTGEVVWAHQELRLKHETGAGSSPVLHGDLLIVHCDGSDVQYLAALDKSSGQLVWQTPRTGEMASNPQFKKAYATPLITRWKGRHVAISPAANWLYAYDPVTGEELWKYSYGVLGFSNVPRPVAGSGMLYVCTGFMKSQLLGLRLDAAGPAQEPQLAWKYGKQVPQIPSPLLVGREIYFVSDDGGVFTCLDAATGEEHYRKRLGGRHAASPLYADGRIYLCDRAGTTHVIRPGTHFELLATNRLNSGCMASPAALGRSLFLRTEEAMICLEAAGPGA